MKTYIVLLCLFGAVWLLSRIKQSNDEEQEQINDDDY